MYIPIYVQEIHQSSCRKGGGAHTHCGHETMFLLACINFCYFFLKINCMGEVECSRDNFGDTNFAVTTYFEVLGTLQQLPI